MRRIRSLVSSVRMDIVQLWGDGQGRILFFVSLGWFATLGVRIVYPALLPYITEEFAISFTTTGGLISMLWFSYAVFQFPGGVLSDRYGNAIVLSASVVVAFVAVLALIFAPVFGVFVVATSLLGVGTGLYGTTRITALSDAFPSQETAAISLSQAAGNVGNIVLPVTAGVVSAALGWRFGFGYLLPVFVVTGLGIWLVVPGRKSSARTSQEGFKSTMRVVAETITQKQVLLVTFVLFLTMFIYQSVTGFLPTYLVATKEVSATFATVLYGLFFASAIVFQFLSGIISDRAGQRIGLAVFIGLSVPAFILLSMVTSQVALVIVVLLLGSVLGGFPPGHAYAVRSLPTEIQGTGYGLLRTVYISLGAGGPVVIGLFADFGFFDEGFILLALVALIASSISIVLLPNVE